MANYRIGKARAAKGMTQQQLAAAVGISDSQLGRFDTGEREPRVGELMRIGEVLGVPWQSLIEDHVAPERFAPLISWVSAGQLMTPDNPVDLEGGKQIPLGDLGPGEWIALRVDGDSMDRISPPDSVILVNMADRKLVPNACYVIVTEEGEATYKRYRGNPPRFAPVSTNVDHDDIYPEGAVRVLGRVRRSLIDM